MAASRPPFTIYYFDRFSKPFTPNSKMVKILRPWNKKGTVLAPQHIKISFLRPTYTTEYNIPGSRKIAVGL